MHEEIHEGWQVLPDNDCREDAESAAEALRASALRLPFTMPAFMLSDLPLSRRWWYRKTIAAPAAERWWLRLPINLREPRLWLNGVEVDLTPHLLRGRLLPPQVEAPGGLAGEVEILMRTDCSLGQYGENEDGGTCFWGSPAILVESEGDPLREARLLQNEVYVKSASGEWRINIGDDLW
ncbi:MAG: hypothetical protein N3A66_10085 [Planctomycetota bacterium]|nr:hypothetical protein [Planctomycetota bacterium]